MRLQGKTAIITGAGSGIGEASARIFAAEGARVAVVDRDKEGGRQQSSGRDWQRVEFLSERRRRKPATDMEGDDAETVLDRFGRIDILFNNAGVSCVGALHETSEEEWDRVMATINAKGVYLACKYVVPVMLQQKAGCIINMASGAAVLGLAQRAAYSASKGAVYSLTRAMQADYCRSGIRVNSLSSRGRSTPRSSKATCASTTPTIWRRRLTILRSASSLERWELLRTLPMRRSTSHPMKPSMCLGEAAHW